MYIRIRIKLNLIANYQATFFNNNLNLFLLQTATFFWHEMAAPNTRYSSPFNHRKISICSTSHTLDKERDESNASEPERFNTNSTPPQQLQDLDGTSLNRTRKEK